MSALTKLYRHFDAADTLLYVGISLYPIARLQVHNGASHWASQIATVRIVPFPTRSEAEAAEQHAIRAENPLYNVRRQWRADHNI
jgi:hypothetical protein